MKTSESFTILFLVAALVSLGLFSTPGVAHHSTVDVYDNSQSIEITGRVVEWRLVNPHPFLILEVEGENGVLEQWDVSFGGSAAAPMRRSGFAVDTFSVGETITVRGAPPRDRSLHGVLAGGRGGNITREDGSSVP